MLFHGLLSLISIFTPYLLISWYIGFFLYSWLRYTGSSQKNFRNFVLELCVYFGALEIICRMSGTSPFIPYENSKYFLNFILLLLVVSTGKMRTLGFLILLAIVPGIVLWWIEGLDYKSLVFNALGPTSLALGIASFYKYRISYDQIFHLLRLLFLPIFMVLVNIFIQTPSYSEIDFQLGANFETSGGFGSNQVSTVMGLGAFIIFFFLISGEMLSGYRLLDIAILILMLFQGLITFSRGGIIAGIMAIVISTFFMMAVQKSKARWLPALLILGFMVLAALAANEITGGNLLLRYQGETYATVEGFREKDVNTLTSNRFGLIEEEFDLFLDNPILGLGIGNAKFKRIQYKGLSSHTEITRLLAEQGLFGILIMLLIAIFCIERYRHAFGMVKALKASLLLIALLSTLHAAMRTFVTPILLILVALEMQNKPLNTKPDPAV